MNIKNYLTEHTIEYPAKSGNKYIFDPYLFGTGAWKILEKTNKSGKFVEETLQKKLNEYYFKVPTLPSLYERFKEADTIEKTKLKEISMAWLKMKIKALQQNTEISGRDVLKERTTFKPGQLYLYVYDAKHKKTLSKWDSLPLAIILERRDTSFLGLNLHYLSINERSILLGKLLQSDSVYNKGNDILKVKINYEDLKKSSGFYKGYEVCIKEYLYSNIRGKILPIDSHEWLYVILLPLENFHYKR